MHIKYLTSFRIKGNSLSTMDVGTFVVTKPNLACDIGVNLKKQGFVSSYVVSKSTI